MPGFRRTCARCGTSYSRQRTDNLCRGCRRKVRRRPGILVGRIRLNILTIHKRENRNQRLKRHGARKRRAKAA